ncbi:hypothetical protein [Amycolatopsis pigmentata]|uniref:Uncharacterized protein n=1 Tax=Amycolatopsis pigmentata TaxID=450801 RepID=A0ABW5G619_9PSEU
MTTTRPEWAPLAGATLTAAILDQPDTTTCALQALVDHHGPDVIPDVLIAWIDTMLRHAGPATGGKPVGLAFEQADSGDIASVDDVAPAVAWAGRLIVARINDDYDQAEALINSVTSDDQWTRNVTAVLDSVAVTLRRAGWGDKLRNRRTAS